MLVPSYSGDLKGNSELKGLKVQKLLTKRTSVANYLTKWKVNKGLKLLKQLQGLEMTIFETYYN